MWAQGCQYGECVDDSVNIVSVLGWWCLCASVGEVVLLSLVKTVVREQERTGTTVVSMVGGDVSVVKVVYIGVSVVNSEEDGVSVVYR